MEMRNSLSSRPLPVLGKGGDERRGGELVLPVGHERLSVWGGLALVLGSTGGLAALTGVRPLAWDLLLRALASLLATPSPLPPPHPGLPRRTSVPLSRRHVAAALAAVLWTTGGVAAMALGASLWGAAGRRGLQRRPALRDADEERIRDTPSFNAVWRAYGGARLALMLRAGVLSRDHLRAKVAFDFDLGHDRSANGGRPDLMKSMMAYGQWVVEWLEVSPASVRELFAQDERVQSMAFSQFVAEGGIHVLHRHDAPKLISRAQLRRMFFREYDQHGWTFEDERSLIMPEELVGAFGQEIARLDLCRLLDLYWEWPLADFVGRLVPDARLAAAPLHLQARYESISKACAKARKAAHAHLTQEMARDVHQLKTDAAERAYNTVVAKQAAKMERLETNALTLAAARGRQRLAEANARREGAIELAAVEQRLRAHALEHARDESLRAINERLASERAGINDEWRAQLGSECRRAADDLVPSAPPLAAILADAEEKATRQSRDEDDVM